MNYAKAQYLIRLTKAKCAFQVVSPGLEHTSIITEVNQVPDMTALLILKFSAASLPVFPSFFCPYLCY